VEPALDVHAPSLDEVLPVQLGEPAPDDHVVELGLLALVGRDAQRGDGVATAWPPEVYRSSGSVVGRPTRITRLIAPPRE